MIYRCFDPKCNWSGPAGEVDWVKYSYSSEAWGQVKVTKGEYATCPECGGEDIEEDDTQESDNEDVDYDDDDPDDKHGDGGDRLLRP
jgi:hypothetical protein